ncbi:MAG: tungstate ABC transporter substrate-binding protein WtpA [Pseudomonadota bacterium]
MSVLWRLCIVFSFAPFSYNLAFSEPSGKVIIFHAGSLTVPFAHMEKEFEARHPNVDIVREPSGSRRCARKIIDLKKPCDIMASADYTVIDNLLIPKYAEWNIRFATNRMVLCYTDHSRFAEEITPDNWYDILNRKGVTWGHAEPNIDPCGYRALMVLQLAERYYKQAGLYQKLIANRPKENIRPKSVELVSLLKTGHMDYAWEYRSVAVQHELKFIELPDQINLGNYKFDDFYGQAVVEVSGKEPGSVETEKGKSCTYGITLIKNAPNRDAALLFLEYLLNENGGLKVLSQMGQPPFIPGRVPTEAVMKKLPPSLQVLAEVKE